MIVSRTPFRVSLFGGGTDYPAWFRQHGGMTIGGSINKYCYISLRYLPPFFDHKYRIVYSKIERPNHLKDIDHPSVRETLRYLDINEGIELHHYADLPARTGLGSSSAFTVGLLNSACGLRNESKSAKWLAETATHIEQNLMHESVGNQDQTMVAQGGFGRLVFQTDGSVQQEKLTSTERIHQLESNLMLFYTGLSRLSDKNAQKISHGVVSTNLGTQLIDIAEAAWKILSDSSASLDNLAPLLTEGWKLKRSLADSISTPEIDEVFERALQAGALGGKLLGAGGGGFLLFYVPQDRQEQVKQSLADKLLVSFRFENQGSVVFSSSEVSSRGVPKD